MAKEKKKAARKVIFFLIFRACSELYKIISTQVLLSRTPTSSLMHNTLINVLYSVFMCGLLK